MKMLILTSLFLIGGAAFAHFMRNDPGYILIGAGNYSIEMSLALFGILFVLLVFVGHYLIKIISSILGSPTSFKKWNQARKEKHASSVINQGLLAQAQGDWKHAEKALIAHVEDSSAPMVNYLNAARAAQAQGAKHRADQYLRMANTSRGSEGTAVNLTKAELLIQSGRIEQAQVSLLELRKKLPKNKQVLVLLAQTYQRLDDWDGLKSLLPELKRGRVIEPSLFYELEKTVYFALLNRAQGDATTDRIRRLWMLLPRDLKTEQDLLIPYAQKLAESGEGGSVEGLIRDSIMLQWNETLVQIYGMIEDANITKQLSVAEAWLVDHEDSPTLLLTLGRLSMRKKFWGKAKTYLEKAAELGDTVESYYALAQLLEQTEEQAEAAKYYKKGLQLAAGNSVTEKLTKNVNMPEIHASANAA